ncbi:MAG: patatin-like phospholipase family protein [Woeseiaceae bacterium]
MSMHSIRACFILAIIFVVTAAGAAEPEQAEVHERPRVGLVLGGGGARGAAHVGVLKELERLRIPIDAIAGTSMGAVVGSLYASGRSPAELEALVGSIDWADAFVDSTRRQDLSFRRKQDDAAFPVQLEVGIRDGELQLPKGLIQGQKLQLILREQLLHVAGTTDFDQLPIPFRAVASDIETGEPYVMSKGDLALAARASMSAPGIFSPVQVDGRTLVDGGLVGNVPVDAIRSMDVDVVIAVDVEFPLYPPDQLESALDITGQMLTILIRKETLRQLDGLGADDVLIRPDLGEFGSTNFAQITETIPPGETATRAQAGRLRGLALNASEYAQHLASRRGADYRPETIDFVRVSGDGPLAEDVLLERLMTEPGDTVDAKRLAEDAGRLYGLNSFENVGYQLVKDGDQTGVEFSTRKKSWGPNFAKFALSLEDDFEGSTAFNVAGRLTMTGLNPLGAEWRNDLQVGTEPRFESEFYQPLSQDSRFFIAPRVRLEQRNVNTFQNDITSGRYRVSEAEFGFDVGRQLGRWGELRLGAFRGAGDARIKVGDPSLPNFDFENGGLFARFSVDTLDDAQIPREGTRANVEWLLSRPGLGADSRFDSVLMSVDRVWSWGDDRRNTMQLGLEYATTFESDDQLQNFFPLGGFLRLSGLERGEISGPHAGLARMMYYRSVGGDGGSALDMPLYIGGSLEAGNVWQTRDEIDAGSLIVNGSIFAGLDTYLGLLFLGVGISEDGDSSFYLFLGNPRR